MSGSLQEPTPYRRALQLAPYALLVAAAFAATLPLLLAPGLPYNVDISGFFPLTPEAYEARFWPLWNEHGGMSTLQFLPALLLELPLLLAGRLLGWDMAVHVKLRILLGFALAGISMYALARYYLRRHYSGRLEPWVEAAIPLAPALLFMFNPWSVHRVFHYFLWIGYALSPLAILALERLGDSPGWRRALLLALVVAAATTDPHNPPLLALLLIPLALVRLVSALRRDRASARALLTHGAIAAGAYLLLSAFWALPYLWNARYNPAFGPTYVLSEEMLGTLSRNGDLWSVLRLLHNYLPRASMEPADGALLTLWVGASFFIPLLALNAPLLARTATAWFYGVLATASIVLGMGDQPPFTELYRWLLFGAPWGEGLSWLFRDPYRWGGFQALAYGVLLAIALAEVALLAKRAPLRLRVPSGAAAPALALAAVLLVTSPGLTNYLEQVYAPVDVPSEYASANAFLAGTDPETQALWMPRMLGSTTWSGDRTLAYFDATSSARAAMGPFRPHTSAYFDYLLDATRASASPGPLVARIGADYLVFHNDRNPAADARTLDSLRAAGFERVGTVGDTPVPTVDQSSRTLVGTPGAKYALHGTRALAQTFTPLEDHLNVVVLKLDRVGSPGPLRVTLEEAESGMHVHTVNASVRADGEQRIPLGGARVVPGVPYVLRLSAPGATSSADHRFDISYYTVDTHPAGVLHAAPDGATWKRLAGDLYFETWATTRGFATLLRNPHDSPVLRASAVPVASPGSYPLLSTLHALPEGSLRDAPVLFTSSNNAAREAYAATEGPWHWVAGLDPGELEPVVPFLPRDTLIAPFEATVTADPATAWARGTPEFSYYEWGWPVTLRAHKQKTWDQDLDRGLAFTTGKHDLTLPAPGSGPRTLLLRVHESPTGGRLDVLAGDTILSSLDTQAASAGFRWVRAGAIPEGATHVTLRNHGGLQAVNLLAAVPDPTLAAAREAAGARLLAGPVTLLAEAEDIPSLAGARTALPGTGALKRVTATTHADLQVPATGEYAVWLRLAPGTAAPALLLDGKPLPPPECRSECGGTLEWLAYPARGLAAGRHVLTFLDPPEGSKGHFLDVVALTNAPGGLQHAAPAPEVRWEKVSATEYRVHVAARGPFHLAFAQAFDAGWTARIDGRDEGVRAVITDGVVNGFLLEAEGPVTLTLTYTPQVWAERGALVSALSLLALLVLVAAGPLLRRRKPTEPDPIDPQVT